MQNEFILGKIFSFILIIAKYYIYKRRRFNTQYLSKYYVMKIKTICTEKYYYTSNYKPVLFSQKLLPYKQILLTHWVKEKRRGGKTKKEREKGWGEGKQRFKKTIPVLLAIGIIENDSMHCILYNSMVIIWCLCNNGR